MTPFGAFLAEFCQTVSERGLQRKFGLKLKCVDELDCTGWTEFEFPDKRSTVTLRDGMPMPDGNLDCSVSTEWKGIASEDTKTCKHKTTCRHGSTTCNHCHHCENHQGVNHLVDDGAGVGLETGLWLCGQLVVPGTPVHDIVQAIVEAF